jgi:hypothetical protein
MALPMLAYARNLAFYWAVRELGMTAAAVAGLLGIARSAVTQAGGRGEKLANDQGYKLISS